MEQTVMAYTDPAEEETFPAAFPEGEAPEDGDPAELELRLREEEARSALHTWRVPVAETMDRCIRERYFPRILQEMNSRLADGRLSELLEEAVVSERILPRDLEIGSIRYWRLNRTDFLADVDRTAGLTVSRDGRDVPGRFAFCLGLWFCTEDGFGFEAQELHLAENRPQRSFWKLDRYLVPVLRPDEVEAGADRIWQDSLPEVRDPKGRTPRMLADRLGLSVLELNLHGQSRVRSCLLFRDSVLLVQEEKRPGEDGVPVPFPRQVPAGTIVLNTAARSGNRNLDILHECVHYEWHLLFYRLQKLMSTSPLLVRYKTVQNTSGRAPCDPLQYMEQHAERGAIALLLPRALILERAWRLYQEASAHPLRNGYLNHPGFRWDRVIRQLADEYSAGRATVRRRLVQLGHPAALGAVNYVDGRYITPFAFTEEHSARGQDTLVISRKGLADLYARNRRFRELMGRGDYVLADGHVCLNDPQYLRAAPEGARLTPWANAHADVCCLRFEKAYLREREPVWIFGSLNSSDEYIREYDRFLDRHMSLGAAERMERRNRLMRELPNDFPDALRYLMESREEGRITCEQLAARAQVSRKTVERYRSRAHTSYNPDILTAMCLAMHLPPWLSRVLMEKAGFPVRSYGPRGYIGEILDCCFMDTVPEVQEYLRSCGYPELKIRDE